MIAKLREWHRRRRVARALKVLRQWGQKELTEICRRKSMQIGRQLSIHGVQHILDRERIAHCAMCPQRFGLRKSNGLLFCKDHYSEPKITEVIPERKVKVA